MKQSALHEISHDASLSFSGIKQLIVQRFQSYIYAYESEDLSDMKIVLDYCLGAYKNITDTSVEEEQRSRMSQSATQKWFESLVQNQMKKERILNNITLEIHYSSIQSCEKILKRMINKKLLRF